MRMCFWWTCWTVNRQMSVNLQRKTKAGGDTFTGSGFQHFLGKKFNTLERKWSRYRKIIHSNKSEIQTKYVTMGNTVVTNTEKIGISGQIFDMRQAFLLERLQSCVFCFLVLYSGQIPGNVWRTNSTQLTTILSFAIVNMLWIVTELVTLLFYDDNNINNHTNSDLHPKLMVIHNNR